MVSILIKKKYLKSKNTIKIIRVKSYSQVFARLVNRLWVLNLQKNGNVNKTSFLDSQINVFPKINNVFVKKSSVVVQNINVINYLSKQQLKKNLNKKNKIRSKNTFNFVKKFGINSRNFIASKEVRVTKNKNYIELKNENAALQRNGRIDNIFFSNIRQNVVVSKEVSKMQGKFLNLTGDLYNIFLKKFFILKSLKINKMFFYFIKEHTFILKKFLNFLWTFEILNLFFNGNKFQLYSYIEIFLSIHSNSINSLLKKENYIVKVGSFLKTFSFNKMLLKQLFLLKLTALNSNKTPLIIESFSNLYKTVCCFSNINYIKLFVKFSIFFVSVYKFINKFKMFKGSFINLVNKLKLKFFFERDLNLNFSTFFLKKFLKKMHFNKKKKLCLGIWKKGNFSFSKYRFNSKIKKGFFYTKHKYINRELSLNFLFLLKRLEEKMFFIKDKRKKGSLEKLRNYFLNFWKFKEKNASGFSFIISNLPNVWKKKGFLKENWSYILKYIFLTWLKQNKNIPNKQTIKSAFFFKLYWKFFNQIYKKKNDNVMLKLSKNFSKVNLVNKKKLKKWKRKRLLKVRHLFKLKRLVKKENYLPVKRQKDLLSFILNKNVSIFYLNALSLSRFAFSQENVHKKSNKFLQNIVREMINKYKYIAIFIKDLVYISFISIFLKKVTFLANFIAFQIEKLPKNRKETRFIKFIIKVVRVSSAQREEIIGLRIKFKGRVNRWRRTKFIEGERGILRYYTYDSRIEYGTAKAITRKGALGIRIWLSYKRIFKTELLNIMVGYKEYSTYLRSTALNRYYNTFVLKNNLKKKLINT